MTILGNGIDIVENHRLKKLLLKRKINLKIKYSLTKKSYTVKKNLIYLAAIQKDLQPKKLSLKHWALVLGKILILKILKY